MHGRPQGAARVDGHTAQRPCNRTSYLIMPLVKPFEGRPLPLVSGVGAAPCGRLRECAARRGELNAHKPVVSSMSIMRSLMDMLCWIGAGGVARVSKQ